MSQPTVYSPGREGIIKKVSFVWPFIIEYPRSGNWYDFLISFCFIFRALIFRCSFGLSCCCERREEPRSGAHMDERKPASVHPSMLRRKNNCDAVEFYDIDSDMDEESSRIYALSPMHLAKLSHFRLEFNKLTRTIKRGD